MIDKKDIIKKKIDRKTIPQIHDAWVNPEKVMVGDKMTIEVTASDSIGISSIQADMGGIETIELKKEEGSKREGVWRAVWKVHGTELKGYTTTVTASNYLGRKSQVKIEWVDPASWWNDSELDSDSGGM